MSDRSPSANPAAGSSDGLILLTDCGLYCEAGDFYVDPWRRVARAIVTHAHTDHARPGCGRYLCSADGRGVLTLRAGKGAVIDTLPYGESLTLKDTRVSLHPAGHVLGSVQVRIEHRGRVLVISGDYKMQPENTCLPFEIVRCHEFISESTFGLPIYRWPAPASVFEEINAWWRENQREQRTSVIFAYALGKAQRILAGLDPTIGPIFAHGAVTAFVPAYAEAGVRLPNVVKPDAAVVRVNRGTAMVVAPPAANGSQWLKKFGPVSTASASGWALVRGTRRWQSVDRGFVLSDHADWDGLHTAIAGCGAQVVGVTHGFLAPMVRYLQENGRAAYALPTRFYGERAPEESAAEADEDAGPAEPGPPCETPVVP